VFQREISDWNLKHSENQIANLSIIYSDGQFIPVVGVFFANGNGSISERDKNKLTCFLDNKVPVILVSDSGILTQILTDNLQGSSSKSILSDSKKLEKYGINDELYTKVLNGYYDKMLFIWKASNPWTDHIRRTEDSKPVLLFKDRS